MHDDAPRRHRRAPGSRPPASGSAVLTPPTGLPATDRVAAPPAPPAPPVPVVVDPCVCRHARAAHEHWRLGSDCGACGPQRCARFRRRGGAVRGLLRRLLRHLRLLP